MLLETTPHDKCVIDQIGNLLVAHVRIFSLSFLILVFATTAKAYPVCSGFDKTRGFWGVIRSTEGEVERACPDGMALLGYQPITSGLWAHGVGTVAGSCCPLPPGSLTGEQQFVDAVCPQDFVATGVRSLARIASTEGGHRHQLRCTRINTDRFSVVEAEGVQISPGKVVALTNLFLDVRTVLREQLPIHLRHGIGRLSESAVALEFCIGFPWGSILRGTGQRACAGGTYYQLRNRDGSELSPACPVLKDPLGAEPICVQGVAQ